VTKNPNGYVSNRVLRLNVGFLLTGGPGNSRDSNFDLPTVNVADDLQLEYLRGPIRLSRTKEGILVQAHFLAGYIHECSRCLDLTQSEIKIDLEELFSYPATAEEEFGIHEDGILDLAPLLRAEVLIITSQRMLCRPDCRGLCPECGANLNHTICTCDLDTIDPRLAELKKLLDPNQ
jgi:uncharacterized protein